MNGQTELELDRALAHHMPKAWHGFFDRYGRLTPVQRAAMPHVLSGKDVLICAATASGKTEAACAPLVERFHGRALPWAILYVSPTRALANDVYYRLLGPAERMGLRIARRTGDYHQTLGGAHIIITTPESFDSLLCRGKISDAEGHVLSGVRAVIMDEIHQLANSPRGEQLRWLVERLRRLRLQSQERGWVPHSDVQALALSATIPNLALVSSRFLQEGIVVHVPGGREIERVGGPDVLPVERALPAYIRSLQDGVKVLVFSGARRRVDTLATELRKKLTGSSYKVIAHHGSLSQNMREEAEETARAGARSVFCATSTLEIGIDIGDIDLVVLDGPAPDMASFFQRIGRGNRRTDQTRVMLCADTHRDATIQEAMFAMAEKGWVGETLLNSFYSVARQQVASYIFQAPQQVRSREKLLELITPMLDANTAHSLLDHMMARGELNCRSRGITLGEMWIEHCTRGKIHSNIASSYGATVIDDKTGRSMATGVMYRGGARVDLAGHVLQVRSWDGSTLAVSKTAGSELPAGELSYVSAGKAPVDGQALALREHLCLATGIWSVVQHAGKDYVFHLGGRRRLALLQYVAGIAGLSIAGNEFWFTADEALIPKPPIFSNFTLGGLGTFVDGHLGALERRLNSPWANQHLPLDLRMREVREMLGGMVEADAIKGSVWLVPTAKRTEEILSRFLGDSLSDP